MLMSEPTGGLASLGINLPMFVAQLINFSIVLFVLWKFAYGPLMRLLDDRTKQIEEGVEKSKEIDARMGRIESEHKELIAQAREEALQIVNASQQHAEARKQEMLAETTKEVQALVARGKEQLQAEKAQMIREAKAELVEIAVAATKKILETTVDEKASQKIAADVIQKMS